MCEGSPFAPYLYLESEQARHSVMGIAILRHSENAFPVWRFLNLLFEIQKLNGQIKRAHQQEAWTKVSKVVKGVWQASVFSSSSESLSSCRCDFITI